MKLLAVAVDYDGTIAENGVLSDAVRDALAKLRSEGILALLVTGRRLVDLQKLTGDLHFLDAIVAENGGVVCFPASG